MLVLLSAKGSTATVSVNSAVRKKAKPIEEGLPESIHAIQTSLQWGLPTRVIVAYGEWTLKPVLVGSLRISSNLKNSLIPWYYCFTEALGLHETCLGDCKVAYATVAVPATMDCILKL